MSATDAGINGKAGSPTAASQANGSATVKRQKHVALSSDEDEDDDKPLAKRPKPAAASPVHNSKPSSSAQRPSAAQPAIKRENDAAGALSDDSDAPLTKRPKPPIASSATPSSSSSAKRPVVKPPPESDDSDDEPLSKRKPPVASSAKKPSQPQKPVKPAAASQPKASARKAASPQNDEEDEDDDADDDDDEGENGDDDDDDEGEEGDGKGGSKGVKHSGDGSQMWETLYHTGPRFPPDYEPVPKDVKMRYNGAPVQLPPAAEEAALFYAVKLETPYVKDPVFNSNFFKDFQTVLKKNPPLDGTKITDFAKCDFNQMCEYQKSVKEAEKERKKKLAPSARKKEQQQKKEAEEDMKTCLVDGQKQRVGNVTVEPPALFMGRGQHPKRGMIKPRVQPEEITINHSLNDPKHPPPAPPAGHKWKAVVQMKDVTWLAHWIDFNGNYKYVYLDATSAFKSNSDREKFEKSRKLDKCVKKLRRRVDEMLVSKSRQERQLGTVIWLIDNYSLRAGNEKGEDEAATYGVCSLLVEHVKELVDAENKVQLEFLGKDSMLFKETLEVPERIFKNIKMFTRSTKDAKGAIAMKDPSDAIFERVDTGNVNKFLRDPKEGGMPGLSAKVFRTYNASTTFQGLLNKTAANLKERGLQPTPQSLKDEYMQANRLVAILCNHQKSVNPQVAERQVARAEEKMVALKYDIHKERQKILTVYKNAKDVKKDFPAKDYKEFNWPQFLEEDLGLTTEQIKEHEERVVTQRITRLEAAFERQELEREYQAQQAQEVKTEAPQKANGRGKKKAPVKEESDDEEDKKPGKHKTKADVEEEKQRLQENLKTLAQERRTNKSALSADSIKVESCARKIKQKFEAIRRFEADLESKNKTSDVSLGTSKINYIDPRISVSWLKHWDAYLVKHDDSGAAGGRGKGKVKAEDAVEDKKKGGRGKGAAEPKAEPDKLDLGLQKLPIGQYFPMTLQKKFKWADTDDDGRGRLPAKWVFVDGAEDKVRTNYSSAQRAEIEESVAATRKDDQQRGGKAAPAGKSAAVPVASSGGGGAGKGKKPTSASSGKKANGSAAPSEKKKPAAKAASDDSDSDVPLGRKN